jgi:hypothetical protein
MLRVAEQGSGRLDWHLMDLSPQGRGDFYAGLDY